MGKKRTLLILAMMACIAGFVVFLLWPASPTIPGVTIENFRRLRVDMTEERVSEIFGRRANIKERWGPGSTVVYWQSPAVDFQIYVDDESGRVTGGETLWAYFERHETEFLGDTCWWTRLRRFFGGYQRVRE